jgi:methionyl-tRNA formyltransferase
MVASPLRVVFFGTPEFAVPTLDALLASRQSVVGVVTQPDRPRGRGQKTSDAPIKARAVSSGLPVLQPDRLKDPEFSAAFSALGADLGVVAAYGRILPEPLLAIPRLGMINVHASLLPRHRGAAPIQRAIMAGDRETGVTIMRVVKALDAGPMMAVATRAIGSEETSEDVERDLARMGAALLVEVVDRLAHGGVEEAPQRDADATYAPRLTKDEGLIDWHRSASEIHNLVRGLYPWPHAFTFLDGKRYILRRTSVKERNDGRQPPGTILEASGDTLLAATGAGQLQILEVQPEGRRALATRDFLAGHHLAAGSRFSGAS